MTSQKRELSNDGQRRGPSRDGWPEKKTKQVQVDKKEDQPGWIVKERAKRG